MGQGISTFSKERRKVKESYRKPQQRKDTHYLLLAIQLNIQDNEVSKKYKRMPSNNSFPEI
jgi:hypothetical protein